MDKTIPNATSARRFTLATSTAVRIAPADKPPRSAPQTLPTCSAEKPAIATRAVLSTGTLTITVYPTRAMNRDIEMERQPSNIMGELLVGLSDINHLFIADYPAPVSAGVLAIDTNTGAGNFLIAL